MSKKDHIELIFMLNFVEKNANKRVKVRKYWGVVYFLGPRISETADKKTANNEGHLYFYFVVKL